MAPSQGKRSFLQGPWHYCGVCDRKWKLAGEQWQRGVLKCPYCTDVMLLGGREVMIAAVLGDGQMELAPAPKLREPDVTTTDDDIFF